MKTSEQDARTASADAVSRVVTTRGAAVSPRVAVLLLLVLAAVARSDTPPACSKCREIASSAAPGPCAACGAATSKGGHFLCDACAIARRACAACAQWTVSTKDATVGSYDGAIARPAGAPIPAAITCLFVGKHQLARYRGVVVLLGDRARTASDWTRRSAQLAYQGFFVYSLTMPLDRPDAALREDLAALRATALAGWRSSLPLTIVSSDPMIELVLDDAAGDARVRGVALLSAERGTAVPSVAAAVEAYGKRPLFLAAGRDHAVGAAALGELAKAAKGTVTTDLALSSERGPALLDTCATTRTALLRWLVVVGVAPAGDAKK